jgi:hypothetical protein
VTDRDAHAPPTTGASSEEAQPNRPGEGPGAIGNAPPVRSSVAESLADIRADRIIADARREAQAIVDAARVDARREARAIVEGARAEAEGIITEAFEQRARIVRRDWAIGDGAWAASAVDRPDAATDAEAARHHTDKDAAGRDLGTAVVSELADLVDLASSLGETLPAGASSAMAPRSDVAPPAAASSEPGDPSHGEVVHPDVDGGNGAGAERAPHGVSAVPPQPTPLVENGGAGLGPTDPEPGARPSPDAARVLAELIESPALRAHRSTRVPLSSRPDESDRPRPPLPVRRPGAAPRTRALLGRTGAPPPPAPPPPPMAEEHDSGEMLPPPPPPPPIRPRSRPRVWRELPAGMRIPPDVPDWDDDYTDPDEL